MRNSVTRLRKPSVYKALKVLRICYASLPIVAVG